jgi:murein DD-endopeptidase MepM/ murein hydrolase activator NlpD
MSRCFNAPRVTPIVFRCSLIRSSRWGVRVLARLVAMSVVLSATGFGIGATISGATLLQPARLTSLVPPVPGGIVDNWRPPSSPYGPGNQGVDLRAVAGQPVLAVGDGVVTFAGLVGGRLFVVIDAGAGLRITLGFLGSVTVRTGQTVRNRDLVAYAKGPVHVGARLGTTYIDPRPLFARKVVLLTR